MGTEKTNTVVSDNVTAIRAVDFVSRFSKGISILKDIFPNIRMIEHKPGEVLYSRTADVTLNENTVGISCLGTSRSKFIGHNIRDIDLGKA